MAAAACASQPAANYEAAFPVAQKVLTDIVAADSIPGAAASVTVGDRIVWHDTIGVTDLSARTPVRAETRFRVGSVTKMLTIAALLRLVDDKRVDLDHPVSRYLPEYPHGQITLRQLAAHLGGIRHYMGAEFLNREHFDNATQSLRRFARDPLVAQPGEKYFYSTYGYNVLGAVIEQVTKKNFPEAMRMLVTGPLDLDGTLFDGGAATTSLYDNAKEGPKAAPESDLSDRLPAGAAVSTARDLSRFMIAMSNETFLSRAAREALLVPLATADGKPISVGIGWRVGTDEKGRMFLHHGGAVTGGRAFVLFYPRERVSVSIVTNLGFARFNEKEALQLAAPFLDAAAITRRASRSAPADRAR
jgi:CubicO group peptidase (beta-lactamase class C family)